MAATNKSAAIATTTAIGTTAAIHNANLIEVYKPGLEMGGMMDMKMACTAMDITPSQDLVATIDPGTSKKAIVAAIAKLMKLLFTEASISDSTNDSIEADAGPGVLTGNYQS